MTCGHAHWESEAAVADGMCPICLAAEIDGLREEIDDLMKANALLDALIGNREAEIERLRADLRRLWHFAGCPFDHCQTCIDDAKWIKSLEDRLGPPSANSVIAQRNY
jgi:hypothetical protein